MKTFAGPLAVKRSCHDHGTIYSTIEGRRVERICRHASSSRRASATKVADASTNTYVVVAPAAVAVAEAAVLAFSTAPPVARDHQNIPTAVAAVVALAQAAAVAVAAEVEAVFKLAVATRSDAFSTA